MKRIILGLFLLTGMCMASYAQKYALVDMEYILQQIPEYKSMTDSLEQAGERWQAEVGKVADEAKNMYESYQQSASALSDAERTTREDAIVAKEKEAAELRRKYFGPEGEMAKLRESMMRPVEDSIYSAIKEIALEQGYDMVIDRASAVSIIFAMPDIDISNQVLAKLGYSI